MEEPDDQVICNRYVDERGHERGAESCDLAKLGSGLKLRSTVIGRETSKQQHSVIILRWVPVGFSSGPKMCFHPGFALDEC